MNLIANTGLQFYTINLEVNLNDNFKMYFHEWFDVEDTQLKLEIAHYFSEDDIWVSKKDIYNQLGLGLTNGKVGRIDVGIFKPYKWEDIKSDFFSEGYKPIIPMENNSGESDCFQMSLSKFKWDKFENTWFPMPFFSINNNKSEFGPTNWCRFKLIPVETIGQIKKYNLLLAFDTQSVFEKEDFEEEDLYETPVFTSKYEKSKNYALCNNEFKLVDYCSDAFNCDWVDKYILKKFHDLDSINDYKGAKPKLNYLAQYVFLVRYIQQLNVLPGITLHSNENVIFGNVDLVVDIGNSRTCAVLFDDGDFTKSSPLELQDFTNPVSDRKLNKHIDSFDMRLAFREADFGGKFGIENSKQFIYPSLIRLGKEANRLIHKSTNMNIGAEKKSTFSSPKRFLWDTKPQKQDWEFVQLDGETAKPVYIKGISEQLNSDGTLNSEGSGGILQQYSRKALMTFAFLEILAQAKMQINSFEQRSHWGEETKPRQIRRIIITCPTAMSRSEQIALRKCAEDSSIVLERFYKNNNSNTIDENEVCANIQVIPSTKKLSLKEERTEWIYDEATCAQFVFLYAEIRERYLKNVTDYFDFYGKVRSDLDGYNKKSLTIGSVDIGAGTTDVMIATYKYDNAINSTLTPIPRFWESFYIAGDDLLKRLVQQLVIEGKYSPIEKKLRSLDKNPTKYLQPFLGTDTGVSARNRQLRSDFNLQISVPIVCYFLDLLSEDKVESKILTYGDIFGNNTPTQSVLNHFKEHFGFDFESLNWEFEKKRISCIIEQTFDMLIGKISALLSYHACDIVLLSGRPTSLKPLTDLFLKHYAISPNRLKTMNNYRVGRWYPEDKRTPFIDGNGNFLNSKSIITTGAMIGHIASNGGLNGFTLNLKELINKLIPTTNYFGKLNEQLDYIETIISPENNQVNVEISTLPFRIGVRQLDIPAYPSRPFYTLDFNDYNLEDRVRGRLENEDDLNAIQTGINIEKTNIKQNMPLKISIERDLHEDIEQLKIVEIVDKNGNQISKNFISLQVQSMSEIENYWLDSGIFSLTINNSHN